MTSSAFLIRDQDLELQIKPHPDNYQIDHNTGYGIQVIRELIRWLQKKPYQRNFKLVLIKEAELLTSESQHALLKTLEEPPGTTIIILASRNPRILINTVRSRCQETNLAQLKTAPPKWWTWLSTTTNDHLALEPFPSISNNQEALATSEKLAELKRPQLIQYLQEWTILLYKNNPEQHLALIKGLSEMQYYLNHNTNAGLTLDLFLTDATNHSKASTNP